MDFNFNEWREKYEKKEIVNIHVEFTIDELELLKKLGIEIKEKIYTEREFEELDMEVIKYYYENDMTEEEKKETVSLPDGVTREEYNKLVNKIHEINLKYKF